MSEKQGPAPEESWERRLVVMSCVVCGDVTYWPQNEPNPMHLSCEMSPLRADLAASRSLQAGTAALLGAAERDLDTLRAQAEADREEVGRLRKRHEWIVALSAGWDANGSTGPVEPLSWESVGRMALDYSRGALLLTDPGGVPTAEAVPALSLGRRVIDVRNGESTAAVPEIAALPADAGEKGGDRG